MKPLETKVEKKAKEAARPLKKMTVTGLKGAAGSLNFMGNEECTCSFRGECTCKNSLVFLDCVSKACASGNCDCSESQYHNSCTNMAETCPELDFQCSADKAVCSVESAVVEEVKEWEEEEVTKPPLETVEHILKDLEDMKEHKCNYEKAKREGWLNADNRLRDLEPVIQKRMDDLAEKGHPLPDMHCYHHFEEWQSPPKDKEGGARVAAAAPALALGAAVVLLLA